jgi:hypothetical protein
MAVPRASVPLLGGQLRRTSTRLVVLLDGRDRRQRTRLVFLLLAGVAASALACGRKTNPKPPELVAPRPVGELALSSTAEGVALRWSRPTEYVDGSSMEDLGGFVIERSRYNSPFRELARVPVTDRGRFQKRKRFEYVDRSVMEGASYHYRVVAFTTDGYYSADSGAATITWSPPGPSPTPRESPAAAH